MTQLIAARRASAILAAVWLVPCLLCFSIILFLKVSGSIDQSFGDSLEKASALYAPHVGAALGIFFARDRAPTTVFISRGSLMAALGVSVFWNLWVIAPICLVTVNYMNLGEALKIAGQAGSRGSWLVAPAVAFFFVKGSAKE